MDLVKALLQNPPLLSLLLADLAKWMFNFVCSGVAIYYFTYVVQNTKMVQIVATITTLVPIVTNLLAPFLVKLTTKRNLMIGEAWYMQAVFSSSSLGVPMFRC